MFRNVSPRFVTSNAIHPEFTYKLMANIEEWLKEAKAFDEKEKVMQYLGLDQFYRWLPQDVKLWVQDRQDVTTVSKAAELAEEFVSRRALDTREYSQRECQNKKAAGGRDGPPGRRTECGR